MGGLSQGNAARVLVPLAQGRDGMLVGGDEYDFLGLVVDCS